MSRARALELLMADASRRGDPASEPLLEETVRGYVADWKTRPKRLTTLDAFTGEMTTEQFGPR